MAAANAYRQALGHARRIYDAKRSDELWIFGNGADLVFYATRDCAFATALPPQESRAMLQSCAELLKKHVSDLAEAGVTDSPLSEESKTLLRNVSQLLDVVVCGDGVTSDGEMCDDGNQSDGDG